MRELVANAAMSLLRIRAIRKRRERTANRDPVVQARQILDEVAFFMGTLGSVKGRTILEVGPGDRVALAPLFLRMGASRYIAFDRFLGDVFGSNALALYRELGCDIEGCKDRIVLRRISVEDANPDIEEKVDVVVSFNVLEHLMHPRLALQKMAAMLRPAGVMIHRVDYGPHDIWRSYPNGLTFLTLPEWLWTSMGSNRGYPNRARHAELIEIMDRLGFKVAQRVTRRFTRGELDAARSYLQPRFRHLSDDDLLVMLAEFACSRDHMPQLGPAFPY